MSDSLYDRNSFIQFGATGNDPLTDRVAPTLKNIPFISTFLVQKADEYRPDKIAAKLYGDSMLYWIILEYNGLSSFSDIEAGVELLIPDLSALNNLLLTCNTQTTEKTLYIK